MGMQRTRSAAVAVLSLCAALLSASPASAAFTPAPEQEAYHGILVPGPKPSAELQNVAIAYGGEPLSVEWLSVGHGAGEPTLGMDAKGNLYYSAWDVGGDGRAFLYRSTDNGHSWSYIPGATSTGQEIPTDLDAYVYVEPDSGRVFDTSLYLANTWLSYSSDQGATWTSTTAYAPGISDHQTFMAAKTPPDNPALTPTDPAFPKLLYYCVNEVVYGGCTVSRDGGLTFQPTGGFPFLTAPEVINPFTQGTCSSIHGHLQTDADGRLYLPSANCGYPFVSISDDGGRTWHKVTVSTNVNSRSRHPELSVDRAGNVYYVWIDYDRLLPYLSVSRDRGEHWSPPRMIAPPGVHDVWGAVVQAGEPGRIAVSFPGTEVNDQDSKDKPWNAYMVVSADALGDDPTFLSARANPVADPTYRGTCGTDRCGQMLDFTDITMDPRDGSAYAAQVDDCLADAGCNKPDGGVPSVKTLGYVVRQVGGPRLLGSLPSLVPPSLKVSVSVARVRLSTARRRGVKVTVRCSAACRGSLRLAVSKREARRLGLARKTVTLGRAKFALARSGHRTVRVKLATRFARRLARAGRAAIDVRAQAVAVAGGGAVRADRLLVVRR